MNMEIGERVIVDAIATGDGVYHHGKIKDIYEFGRFTTLVDVEFDKPDLSGRWGITLTNLGLIRKEAAE